MTGVSIKNIKCRLSTISAIDQDLIYIQVKGEDEFKLSDFAETTNAIDMISASEQKKLLIALNPRVMPTVATRNYLGKSKLNNISARAFVTKSLAHKIIGNFIINFNRPNVPMRLFSSEEDALTWLKEV